MGRTWNFEIPCRISHYPSLASADLPLPVLAIFCPSATVYWHKMSSEDKGSAPAPEAQKIEIKALIESSPLEVGGRAFLISAQWFTAWKMSVGFVGNDEPNGTVVTKITNSDLLDKHGKLKEDIRERTEYEILSEPVFKKLSDWFGCDHEIEVPVLADENGKPVAVTRVIHLQIRYKDRKTTVETNSFAKVGAVIDTVKDELKWKETELRVFDYFNKHIKARLDLDKTVRHYQLVDKQALLIDSFDKGTWLSDSKKKEEEAAVSSKSTTELNGRIGLSNMGNTCFFNSGTQCLLHTRLLARHMLGTHWKSELNEKNPIGMKGQMATAFANLCKEAWRGSASVIAPRDLKSVVGRFAPQFSGWGQQDSHELITYMLDGIHEDLNRCRKKENVEAVLGDGTDNIPKAAEAWKRHLKRNDSIVTDHIHGQYMSTLVCPDCGGVTVVFDPYMALPIPINRPHTVKVAILFVPYEFSEPATRLRIELPSNAQLSEQKCGEEISKAVGRDVNVILGSRWSTSSPMSWDRKVDSYATTYAFEVPDKEKVYLIGSVKMPQKTYYSSYPKEISSPFLVQVPSLEVTEEEITQLCEEKLKSIWDVSESETIEDLPEEKRKLAKDVVPPKESLFEENQKLKIEIGKAASSYLSKESGDKLTVSKRQPCVAENVLTVTLNPKVEFSYSKVMINYEELGHASKSKLPADRVTLASCFEYYQEPEVLDEENKWFCPRCRQFVCAQKKLDIWKVPEVLIIQLKRFVGGRYQSKKLDTFVDFPDILDMHDFVVGPQKDEESLKYRLYAVSNHMGGLGGGHYTAHAIVQSPFEEPDPNAQWYSFNDSSCSPSSAAHAHSGAAYVLFYERIHDVSKFE